MQNQEENRSEESDVIGVWRTLCAYIPTLGFFFFTLSPVKKCYLVVPIFSESSMENNF